MKEWVKWLLLGILSVAFGIFVLGAPVVASVAVTLTTGILFLVSGGFQVFAGFTAEGAGNKIFLILMGLLMLFIGWSFLSNPLAGTISLSMLVLILFLVSGVIRIIFSMQMRGTEFFWPTMISGILSVVLAIIIWVNAAEDPAWLLQLLGILLGIELIFNGLGLIFLGLFLRKAGDKIRDAVT